MRRQRKLLDKPSFEFDMQKLMDQFQLNVTKGPCHEEADRLPDSIADEYPVRFIAFYLPQFHAIKENDAWWGRGFTEWNNVVKALPRYAGHKQPKLPADLGFYDLSHSDVIRRQAALAKRGGIFGFCIHDYWFSGYKVLETPLQIILKNRDIDLRFCLNWANENWSRRWDGSENDILLMQRYEEHDDVRYAESILPAIADPRYIKINGRPVIMFYRPKAAPDARRTVKRWRNYFMEKGVGNPYVIMAQAFNDFDPRPYEMDAAAGFPPHGGWELRNDRDRLRLYDVLFRGHIVDYGLLAKNILAKATAEFKLFPGVCPDWDNDARKPGRSYGLYGSTPARYGAWLKAAAEQAIASQCTDERIVFINAWNEWAEGAYLEPDQHHGYAYLAETRRVLDRLAGRPCDYASHTPPRNSISRFEARPSGHRKPFNRVRRKILSVIGAKGVSPRR